MAEDQTAMSPRSRRKSEMMEEWWRSETQQSEDSSTVASGRPDGKLQRRKSEILRDWWVQESLKNSGSAQSEVKEENPRPRRKSEVLNKWWKQESQKYKKTAPETTLFLQKRERRLSNPKVMNDWWESKKAEIENPTDVRHKEALEAREEHLKSFAQLRASSGNTVEKIKEYFTGDGLPESEEEARQRHLRNKRIEMQRRIEAKMDMMSPGTRTKVAELLFKFKSKVQGSGRTKQKMAFLMLFSKMQVLYGVRPSTESCRAYLEGLHAPRGAAAAAAEGEPRRESTDSGGSLLGAPAAAPSLRALADWPEWEAALGAVGLLTPAELAAPVAPEDFGLSPAALSAADREVLGLLDFASLTALAVEPEVLLLDPAPAAAAAPAPSPPPQRADGGEGGPEPPGGEGAGGDMGEAGKAPPAAAAAAAPGGPSAAAEEGGGGGGGGEGGGGDAAGAGAAVEAEVHANAVAGGSAGAGWWFGGGGGGKGGGGNQAEAGAAVEAGAGVDRNAVAGGSSAGAAAGAAEGQASLRPRRASRYAISRDEGADPAAILGVEREDNAARAGAGGQSSAWMGLFSPPVRGEALLAPAAAAEGPATASPWAVGKDAERNRQQAEQQRQALEKREAEKRAERARREAEKRAEKERRRAEKKAERARREAEKRAEAERLRREELARLLEEQNRLEDSFNLNSPGAQQAAGQLCLKLATRAQGAGAGARAACLVVFAKLQVCYGREVSEAACARFLAAAAAGPAGLPPHPAAAAAAVGEGAAAAAAAAAAAVPPGWAPAAAQVLELAAEGELLAAAVDLEQLPAEKGADRDFDLEEQGLLAFAKGAVSPQAAAAATAAAAAAGGEDGRAGDALLFFRVPEPPRLEIDLASPEVRAQAESLMVRLIATAGKGASSARKSAVMLTFAKLQACYGLPAHADACRAALRAATAKKTLQGGRRPSQVGLVGPVPGWEPAVAAALAGTVDGGGEQLLSARIDIDALGVLEDPAGFGAADRALLRYLQGTPRPVGEAAAAAAAAPRESSTSSAGASFLSGGDAGLFFSVPSADDDGLSFQEVSGSAMAASGNHTQTETSRKMKSPAILGATRENNASAANSKGGAKAMVLTFAALLFGTAVIIFIVLFTADFSGGNGDMDGAISQKPGAKLASNAKKLHADFHDFLDDTGHHIHIKHH